MKILCIGADRDHIRFGQIEAGYKKNALLHLSAVEINGLSEEEVSAAVLNHINQERLHSEQYAVVVDSSDCFVRHLSFPFRSKDKIAQVIKEELETELPLSIDDMMVDFFVSGAAKNSQYSVVGFAYPEAKIEKILSMLKPSGIDPDFIIPDISALKGVSLLHESGGNVVIDIKDNRTNYYRKCANGGEFLRSMHSGQFKSLSSGLVSADFKAENIYGECNIDFVALDCQYDTFQKIKPELASIYECDILSFNDYFNQFHTLSKVYVDNVSLYSDVIGALLLISKHYDVVNFRKGRYKKSSAFENIKEPLLYILISLNIILASFLFYKFNENLAVERALDNSNKSIEMILKRNFPKLQKHLSPIQYKSLFLGKIDELQGGSQNRYNTPNYTFIELFNAVSKAIPKSIDISVERIVYDQNIVLISGHAKSYDLVDKTKRYLSKIKMFDSVEIKKAKTVNAGGIAFDISLKVKAK